MDWLKKAEDALRLISEGRRVLTEVKDAVTDGSAALSTTDQDKLDQMLEQEMGESRAAHDSLKAAIAAARAKG